MRSLRLTAELATPVAGASPIHADGLLMAVHRGMPREPPGRGTPTADLVRLLDLRHPSRWIVIVEHAGHQVALCSAMQGDAVLGLETIVQRRDARDVEALAGKVDRSAGPDRDKMLPVPTREVRRVSWDCVGWRREILSLTRSVRYVGALRRHGYGVVLGWDCVAAPEPFSLVRDGVAVRHLPADWCSAAARVDFGAVEPPYWHSGRFVRRVPAGTECELTKEAQHAVDAVVAALA